MTMMDARQRHHGSLHISPGSDGLRATIDITNSQVVIAIDRGDSFAYGRGQVEGRVFDSRTVLLNIVGDDDLYFVADDPFLFTAKAMPELRADGSQGDPAEPQVNGSDEVSRRLPVIGATIRPAKSPNPSLAPASRPKRRDRARATCDHQWRSLSIAGGLIRRVCNDCGVVSIDLSE